MTETHLADRDYIKSRLHEYLPLNLHLVSAHCNGAALTHTRHEAFTSHKHEHDGPGTIRNHDRKDLFWDADKVADVILECAEGDTPEEIRASIDDLLTPTEVEVRMAPDEHTHEVPARGEPIQWEVCTAGGECQVYPRYYDLYTTRKADGTNSGFGSSKIDNAADDMARGLIAARSALIWAQTVASNPDDPHPMIEKMATEALAQFGHSMALLHPLMYPDYVDYTNPEAPK